MRPYGLTMLRWCVGAVFAAHGAQKLFGMWGGPGLGGTSAMLHGLQLPYPAALAVLLAVTELGGGILLILGGLTRWVALALTVVMGVAIWKVQYAHGFFLSSGGGPGRGYEFNLVLIGALVCLMLSGPGPLSLDEWKHQSSEVKARARARARNM